MKPSDIEDADTLATKRVSHDVRVRLETMLHKEILDATIWGVGVMSGILFAFAGVVLRGVYFMLAHWKP